MPQSDSLATLQAPDWAASSRCAFPLAADRDMRAAMPRPPAHDASALLQDLADTWRCNVADLSCGKETLLQRLWAGCVCCAAGGP